MFPGPVHPIPPLKGAAVETWIYEVSRRLVFYEPHIACIGSAFHQKNEFKNGVYFHRITFGKFYKTIFQKITRIDPLSYPRRLLKIINEIKPDVVHMHNSVKWFLPVIEAVNKNMKNTKIILHLHNEIEINNEIAVDAFMGCSKYIVDIYQENKKIKAKYYKYIYNGVDLTKFRPYWESEEVRKDVRNRFNLTDKDFVVLFVGRISPEKGVEHVIDTAYLLRDIPNIKFLVVGEIPTRGSRLEYAKNIIQATQSLKDKISFTDVFPPFKMNLIYMVGDVIFIPSNFEAFGMVALEAMATGLPVITRKKGGLKEFILDNENGFFVSEDNISTEAANIIERLILNKELKRSIGEKARQTAEKFDWIYISEELERFYTQILS